MTRILVCGGRDFPSDNTYRWLVDNLEFEIKKVIPTFKEITLLIEGGAKGADLGASRLAVMRPLPHLTIPAQWEKYGKVAGVIRNKRMLEEGKPDIAIAFPGMFWIKQFTAPITLG